MPSSPVTRCTSWCRVHGRRKTWRRRSRPATLAITPTGRRCAFFTAASCRSAPSDCSPASATASMRYAPWDRTCGVAARSPSASTPRTTNERRGGRSGDPRCGHRGLERPPGGPRRDRGGPPAAEPGHGQAALRQLRPVLDGRLLVLCVPGRPRGARGLVASAAAPRRHGGHLRRAAGVVEVHGGGRRAAKGGLRHRRRTDRRRGAGRRRRGGAVPEPTPKLDRCIDTVERPRRDGSAGYPRVESMKPPTDFPRVPLAVLPTPLEPLERLGRALDARLWMKRDDYTG